MKLKNRLTGEIGTLVVDGAYKFVTNFAVEDDEMNRLGEYNSLAELNEEWEDAPEEPKEYYCIDWTEPDGIYKTRYEDVRDDFNKEIGNCFNTREEVKKAVEELKAAKRLKDKGFRFDRWNNVSSGPYRPIWFYFEKDTQLGDIKSDLDLLFGGEE